MFEIIKNIKSKRIVGVLSTLLVFPVIAFAQDESKSERRGRGESSARASSPRSEQPRSQARTPVSRGGGSERSPAVRESRPSPRPVRTETAQRSQAGSSRSATRAESTPRSSGRSESAARSQTVRPTVAPPVRRESATPAVRPQPTRPDTTSRSGGRPDFGTRPQTGRSEGSSRSTVQPTVNPTASSILSDALSGSSSTRSGASGRPDIGSRPSRGTEIDRRSGTFERPGATSRTGASLQQQLEDLNRRSRGDWDRNRSDFSRSREARESGSREVPFRDNVARNPAARDSDRGSSRYYGRPTDASDWNRYRDWSRDGFSSRGPSNYGDRARDHDRYPGGYRPAPPPPPPKPAVRSQVVVNIQTGFGGYGTYWTPDWYGRYGRYNYWRPPVVISPSFWWRTPNWGITWNWFGGYAPYYYRPAYYSQYVYTPVAPNPVYYNYGDNVVYRDDMVYVNGVPYVSADKYYEQGLELAKRGEKTTVIQIQQPAPQVVETDATSTTASKPLSVPTPALPNSSGIPDPEKQSSDPSEQWMPLGTFALLKDEEKAESDRIFQLAMNRGGIVRGNLYDQKEDKLLPIQGAVDQETQRVAFQVVGDDSKVYECGLWNLTQESLPLLVQEGKGAPETIKVVRLKENESTENNNVVGPTLD